MNQNIFISIASYQDPILFFTLQSAIHHAEFPLMLRFGVVDQSTHDQRTRMEALPYGRQVRYVHMHPQDTQGVCWARNIAFSLYDGEQYLLQVDSHTCFEAGWDSKLRAQHRALLERSAKPIISTYPYRFDFVNGVPHYKPSEGKTALVLRPHPDTPLSSGDVVMRFVGRHMVTDSAVPGCHIAAGFLFCGGQFVEEVPYDPFLYFHGEEQSLAVRAYTRGWDIFHPTWTPLYHLYKEANVAHESHHWHDEDEAQRSFSAAYLNARAKLRLARLLCGDGLPGAYGLGTTRTMEEFRALSGIDYRNRSVIDPYPEGVLMPRSDLDRQRATAGECRVG
ncbi:GlcNAc-transferase family protein [Pseudoduganella sp.]|uniref:GlcNAc-transferase family protein n=1 Tax=Pseudoduganella sp. TaxID=1880898 RepID=UPI0035B48BF3